MNTKVTSLLLGLILLGSISFHTNAQTPSCPPRHCAQKATIINRICKDLGDECESVYLKHNEDVCTCDCPTKSILAFKSGEEWRSPENPDSTIFTQTLLYVIYVEVEDDLTLLVLPKHLFLTGSGFLKRADRLTPNDVLLDKDRNELKITAITSGTYTGNFSLIPMPEWSDDKNIDDHLESTYGVLSGDAFATTFFQSDSLEAAPQLGTPEYFELIDRNKDHGSEDIEKFISLDGVFEFKPFQEAPILENTVYLFEPAFAVLNSRNSVPLDKRDRQQMAIKLIETFESKFPDIKFKMRWRQSWPTATASAPTRSRRIVTLNGGLVRLSHMGVEGVSLALAHEVGHHYGGPPRDTGETWASCEGQADYWAALVGMRKVWSGPSVIKKIEDGANQLLNTQKIIRKLPEAYQKALLKRAARVCDDHGTDECRLKTFLSGLSADPKPACATR